ncbi:ATP-binding protein [Archangium violaceum]
MFEPFFTTKPPGEGNIGLGLSLSHDIVVKMHGGQLAVESEPDRYTRFTISLPKATSVGSAADG